MQNLFLKKFIAGVFFVMLLTFNFAFAQFPGEEIPPHKHHEPNRKEILSQYRKLELLKRLDMDQATADKVLPLLNELGTNREEFFLDQKELFKKINQEISKENFDSKKLSKWNDEFINNKIMHEEENKKIYNKIRKHL